MNQIFKNKHTETTAIDEKRVVYEKRLFIDLQKLSKHIINEIISAYKINKNTIIANIVDQYNEEIRETLNKSYREISSVFGNWNRNKFNVLNGFDEFDVNEIKADIEDIYHSSLSEFINESSKTHANYIIQTTKDDAEIAIKNSQIEAENQIKNLENQTNQIQKRLFELAYITTNDRKLLNEKLILTIRLNNLNRTISDLKESQSENTLKLLEKNLKNINKQRNSMRAFQETSYAQSKIMQIEAESMEKEDRKISKGLFAGYLISEIIEKEWDGIRDGHQRNAHMMANGQKRKIHEPFLVGGELGQCPKADSFSMKNKARCRCFVVYNFRKRVD